MLYVWRLFSVFVVLALLFLLAPATVLLGSLEDVALPGGSAAVLAGEGDVDYIIISPDNASIDGGGAGTQAYSAEAFDAQGISLGDVTQNTTFTIEPEAGGSWEGCTYTSEHVGDWLVTGTHTSGKTDTAILWVLETPEYPGGESAPPEGGASSSTPPGATTEAGLTPPVGGGCEPPHLEVDKTVSPETICLNNQATVTLNVTGAGEPAEEHFPIDVMLIIDRSGSMQGQKLTAAKAAAKTFVGLLNSTSDRSGLVSYHTTATLNHNLTFNKSAINSSINSLTTGLYTNIADGIDKANTELINHGRVRPPVIYGEILLSDGQANRPSGNAISAALAKAHEAANNTIVIYTIGLGTDVDNTTMQNIANITGGKYYYAPNSTTLQGIYQEIAGELCNIAGTNVVVTEVLPGGVNYVNGSAVPPPNSTSGQNLTWNWSSIIIGSTKTMTFNVTFNNTGYQPVDVYPDTRVNYTNYQGNPASEAFPQTNITVNAAPVANFTANNTNPWVNTPIQFTDLSTGNPTSWSWDFSGGSPSNATGQGPQTVTYSSAGNYTVSLNVTNACGSNTMTKTNYITVTAAINQYNLTISSTSGGNVTTPGEGTYTYNASQVVNLVATADANYHFVNWTGDVGTIGNVTSATTNITMNGNYSITATFAIKTYTITATAGAGGSISPSGAVSVNCGANKTFNITADSCYNIADVLVDGSPVGAVASYTFTNVTANHTISATFAIKTYTITATAGAGGSISPSGAVSVNCGANKTFNITADSCYNIADVSVDSVSQGAVASYTFTNVTANHTITATFAIKTYTINATAGAGGSISPSGAVSVNCGANKTFNITADSCYNIAAVLVDGSPVGAVASYTFTNVTANHTISATFAIKTYTITATAGANGNISPSGAVSVNCGANQTFNITADSCYNIADVVVDTVSQGAVASYTFTNVTANHTISATFAIKTYTITATAGGGGSISPSGAVSVNCGADKTFNITADSCYNIANVLVDTVSQGAVASYTFTNVTANHTISATFAIKTYTITATAGTGGSISPSGAVSVNCGADKTFNITADSCYNIANVLVDTVSQGAVANYTFGNVTANHTITVIFIIKTYTINATAGTGGSISPSGAVSVNCGADKTFNITADSCYNIAAVLVDSVSQGAVASYTFTNVTANHTISATFAIKTYTITATAGGGGSISPSGAVSVNCGADKTFNITADSCYNIADVVVDTVSKGAVASYTFTNVTANHTISATFAIKTYTITATAGAGGSISPSGAVSVNCGADKTFNITADSCYNIADVVVDTVSKGAVASYTFTNVTANHTISATFAIKTYTITATAGAGGSISPSGAVSVGCGADKTFNITADSCYNIANVLVDTVSQGAVANYTFGNVTANHTITVIFIIKTYTINATAGTGGSISPSGAVSVNCGADKTFNITADSCYNIAAVLVDSVSQGAVASYTFTNVTANHTISATFAIKTYTITATAGAGGSISPSGAVSVNCGADKTFNITADSCYNIADVVVDTVSKGAVASYTFTNVTANHTISATFAIKTYTITATAGAGGSISPSGAVSVGCGVNKTFNITADSCYNIANVLVDTVSQGAVANYTFGNVTANHTITVIFIIKTYTINATAGTGGSISPSGAVSVNCGADKTFNITADSCYNIADVVVDTVSKGAVASYTFTNVTANHTISATFAIKTYTMTVNVTPSGGGNVTVNGATPSGYPNTTTWNCGENVTLNAVAANGYIFVNWSGDLGGSVNPTNITMNSIKDVTAHFSAVIYNLTVTSNGCCPINVSGAVSGTVPAGGNKTFTGIGEGGEVTVSVDDSAGCCKFDNWSDAGAQTHTITMNSDKSVTAYCSVPSYDLTVNVSPGGGGNVTVNGATPSGYPNITTWNCGENVTLNAVAASGYHFVNWTGNLTGSANPTNITMNDNKSVTANFALNRYNLTVNVTPSNGGSVTVNGTTPTSYPNSTTWVCGSNVTLNAVAASGYHFVNWTGSLTGSTNPTNITMNDNKSVTANFALNRYNLTVNVTPSGGGNVTVNGTTPTSYPNTTTWNNGDVVTLNATAASGYHFVNWTGSLTGSTNPTNITMNDNKSVTANFALNRYNLTVNVTPSNSGNVTVNGTTPTGYPNTTTWNNGDVVTLNATAADANYDFVNWTGDVGTVANVTSATTNITMNGNYSIVANFVELPKICVSPPSLSLKVAPNTTVTKTYTITNCGGGTLHWDSSNVTYVPNGNMTWLSQNITSGTLSANASQTVLVTVNTTGLAKGTYNAFITITGSTFILPIILDVGAYNLTISSTSGGNVTTPGEGTFTYNVSEVVDLVATADSGYHFVNWTGDVGTIGNVNSPTTNITMNENYTIVANFATISRYNLNISSTTGGNVTTPGEGTFTYNASEVVDLVATADSGYYFVNWTGDVGTIGNVTSATTNITMNENHSIMANFTEHIDVMRDLPPDALDPDAEYPGDSFYVYVNFTAPVDNFNAIGLTDLAPAGWEVETDINWCSPVARWTMSPGNKAEYSWAGPYSAGQNFTARYLVTIPATASPGIYEWPRCPDMDEAWVEYWFGPVGPYKSCITGDFRKIVTVPGMIVGETRDVNADLLTTTLVVCYEEPPQVGDEPEDSDSSTEPDALYKVDVDDTGQYYMNASKYCYFGLDTNAMPGTRNPSYPDYINFTTVELLAAGYNLDFEGDYGLVPKACPMAYAMESVNHWLFIPLDGGGSPHPEWQLSNWKAMESIHSWQFPCGCNT